jgi:hypothetical protein
MMELPGLSPGHCWGKQPDEITNTKRLAMHLLVIMCFLERVGCIQFLTNKAVCFLQSSLCCCGILTERG